MNGETYDVEAALDLGQLGLRGLVGLVDNGVHSVEELLALLLLAEVLEYVDGVEWPLGQQARQHARQMIVSTNDKRRPHSHKQHVT